MKINLYQSWFDSPVRPQEFERCRAKNLELFDRVIYLKWWPTYSEFFREMMAHPEDINIVANLDIYFDKETFHLLKNIRPDVVYCLTRWDEQPDGELLTFSKRRGGHDGSWSQDAWVFKGFPTTKDGFLLEADFKIGSRGCDNHIAWVLAENGYKLHNPSQDIKIIHVHNIDTNASYNRGERVGEHETRIPVPPSKLIMI